MRRAAGGSLVMIGIGFALVPLLQARWMDVAGDAQLLLAAPVNHSAFNLSNAIGPWTGAVANTAGWRWQSTGLAGAALAAGGIVVMIMSLLCSWPGTAPVVRNEEHVARNPSPERQGT